MTKKYEFPENIDTLYEIARDQVAKSVAERVAENERHRERAKDPKLKEGNVGPTMLSDKGVDGYYDARNRREREYYSKVMIGRRSDKKKNRYYLIYAGQVQTGGFRTAQDAGNWYVNNGR